MGKLVLKSRHRLMCGDSTCPADVAKLLNSEQPIVCITDPPYSVNYDKSHETRGGDKTVHKAYQESGIDPAQVLSFMDLVPCDVMLWSYPIDRHFQILAECFRKYGWEFRKELVWVKDSFSFWMSAKYQQKHEPIILSVRKGKSIGGTVPSNATTVFEFARPKSHDLHPTAKPIELWSALMRNHSAACDIVYEPFSGSGTTLICAEQLSRRCFAMEMSAQYVDVAVRRWEALTGEQAIKWHA